MLVVCFAEIEAYFINNKTLVTTITKQNYMHTIIIKYFEYSTTL